MNRSRLWHLVRWPVLAVVVALVAIQLVPYGWRHPNPPVIRDAPWPTAASERIARSSCYSCHSNETDWPVYSYVAPMSWLVRSDVERGRDDLNFSDWGEDADESGDAIEVVLEGNMPPSRYTAVHRDADLMAEEARVLVEALRAMDRDQDREHEDADRENGGEAGGD